ncbi:MAG: (2E,6E)-farnesyl diphosphate synthase [Rhodanobacteraceae bacterium]|jgi:farnesyl diphosphate synthase|nr:MAG: (2E,6E)-farnesyl diphosphate synthase [Rhodanobacteraceae bacterium]
MSSFADRVAGYRDRLEQALDARLPAAETPPASLHAAMRYAALGGGKRIRPLLCYASGEVLSVPADRLDDAACAVECVHVFSLVHDDLPAMDDDALRRGKPSTHAAFGVATAILAGDALQTRAFEILSGDGVHDAAERLGMIALLATATGSQGMTGGQAVDLESEGKQLAAADLEALDRDKTGKLIRAAVLMPCCAVPNLPAASRDALDRFAECMGLAFQIKDDVLDVEGEQALTGKTKGADAARGKATYPSLMGMDNAKRRADALYAEALAALGIFGDAAEPLRWLARYIVHRDH